MAATWMKFTSPLAAFILTILCSDRLCVTEGSDLEQRLAARRELLAAHSRTLLDESVDAKARTPAKTGEFLLCFSVAQSKNYELALMQAQLERKAGIFACNGYTVFSDTFMHLGVGPLGPVTTTVLPISLQAPKLPGAAEHIQNNEIFLTAWTSIVQSVQAKLFDWYVKADPDAVVLPDRLRFHLSPAKVAPHNVAAGDSLYVTNVPCLFHFFGSLEIVSRGAAQVYIDGVSQCQVNLKTEGWGEDLFMRRCFQFLNVSSIKDNGVLSDGYCSQRGLGACTSGEAAFHPFKANVTWLQCWDEAHGQPVSV